MPLLSSLNLPSNNNMIQTASIFHLKSPLTSLSCKWKNYCSLDSPPVEPLLRPSHFLNSKSENKRFCGGSQCSQCIPFLTRKPSLFKLQNSNAFHLTSFLFSIHQHYCSTSDLWSCTLVQNHTKNIEFSLGLKLKEISRNDIWFLYILFCMTQPSLS